MKNNAPTAKTTSLPSHTTTRTSRARKRAYRLLIKELSSNGLTTTNNARQIFVISLSGNTVMTPSGRTITWRCFNNFLKKLKLSANRGESAGSLVTVSWTKQGPRISVSTPLKSLRRQVTKDCLKMQNQSLDHPHAALPSVMPAYLWKWRAIVLHVAAQSLTKREILDVLSDMRENYIHSIVTCSAKSVNQSVFRQHMPKESMQTPDTSRITT